MMKSSFRSILSLTLAFLLAFSVIGTAAVAASVTVVKAPNKTSFYQGIDWSYNKSGKISLIGGDFDISGTVLSYNSKTVEYTIGKWPNMNTKPMSGQWVAGTNKMKIYCDDFPSGVYATIDVNLVEVDEIAVVSPPKKTVLIQDKDWILSKLNDVEFTELDMTGTQLKVTYTDGSVKTISYPQNQLIDWSVDPEIDSYSPGAATLYATFAGKMAPFNVVFLKKGESLLGDVNNDNKINSGDALLILQGAVGRIQFNDNQKIQADVTKDGKINSTDALTVLQFVVGKISSF